jgi:pilus assembly protein CpaB
MNTKAMIPLIAGLVVGGIALKLGADTVRRARGAQAVSTVPIWVAAVDIRRGDLITEASLSTIEFPAKMVPDWAFQSETPLQGRVAKSTTFMGEIIHQSALMPEGTLPGLPVPLGLRAVGVKIDEASGVDYHLEPGSYVDVIAYFNTRRGSEQKTIARTIIENVEVGAVGDRISAEVTEEEDAGGARTGIRKVRAVTLFVKPKDVPALALAENQGRIKLSMRGQSDLEQFKNANTATGAEVVYGEEPETEAEKETTSVGGFFTALFGAGEPEPKQEVETPEPEPVVEAKPAEPVWVHRMVIMNGDERVVLAWRSFDQPEPTVLEGDAGSLFGSTRGDSLFGPTGGGSPLLPPTQTTNPPLNTQPPHGAQPPMNVNPPWDAPSDDSEDEIEDDTHEPEEFLE